MSTRVRKEESPYVAPEQYGVRVVHQSPAEQVEAAQFLLATRQQEDARRRALRLVARLRSRTVRRG